MPSKALLTALAVAAFALVTAPAPVSSQDQEPCPSGLAGATCRCYATCFEKRQGHPPDPKTDPIDATCFVCCIGMAPLTGALCAPSIINDPLTFLCQQAVGSSCDVLCASESGEASETCKASCRAAVAAACGAGDCGAGKAACDSQCDTLETTMIRNACKGLCTTLHAVCTGQAVNPLDLLCDLVADNAGEACAALAWDPTGGLGTGEHCAKPPIWPNSCNICCEKHCGSNLICKSPCLRRCALGCDNIYDQRNLGFGDPGAGSLGAAGDLLSHGGTSATLSFDGAPPLSTGLLVSSPEVDFSPQPAMLPFPGISEPVPRTSVAPLLSEADVRLFETDSQGRFTFPLCSQGDPVRYFVQAGVADGAGQVLWSNLVEVQVIEETADSACTAP